MRHPQAAGPPAACSRSMYVAGSPGISNLVAKHCLRVSAQYTLARSIINLKLPRDRKILLVAKGRHVSFPPPFLRFLRRSPGRTLRTRYRPGSHALGKSLPPGKSRSITVSAGQYHAPLATPLTRL